MDWYRESFGRDYLKIYAHRDGNEARKQVDFIEAKLEPAPGAKILDLCCGSGRHVRELAGRGYGVVGLDLSRELLEVALREMPSDSADSYFVRADMRALPFKSGFDFVLSFFTSFGYFEREDEDEGVLRAVAGALKPGGFFVLDYLNPGHVRAGLVPQDSDCVSGLHVRRERWIDDERRRIEKRITVVEAGKEKVYRESVRLYSPGELSGMMEKTGLNVKETCGDFDGNAFYADSPRMIIISEKK